MPPQEAPTIIRSHTFGDWNDPMMELRALAYVVAETTDLAAWTRYGESVLGMQAAAAPEGWLWLKMDERQFRVAVGAGVKDRYVASGWEVQDADAFERTVQTLRDHGVAHEIGPESLCRLRRVQQLVSFADPSGNTHEVSWGFQSDFLPFVSPVGIRRFVTDPMGLGHTVLPAPQFEATARFVREVMGFGLSDLFNFKPQGDAGPSIPIHFFHCANGRHHSLALAGFPAEAGCVHVMVEVEDVPEVGRALDRMREHQVLQTATLGQHTNDRMISFYMKSPSGFEFEFGTGGAVMDWSQHIAHEFTRVSLWGHDFSVGNQNRA